MRKLILCLCFYYLLASATDAQTVSGKLHFEKGKTIVISMDIKNSITQQAGAQAVDFSATGSVIHFYKITGAGINTTLHHNLLNIKYRFDGMGQTRSFDSGVKKLYPDSAGKQAKEILLKEYDLIVDSSGTVISCNPEKIGHIKNDEHIVILKDMLTSLATVAYPPKKGASSFFKILPDRAVGIGDTWTETTDSDDQKSTTINTLTATTDSTIVIAFKSTSTSITKSEMMGMQAITKMNYTSTGNIILDKTTGIMKEKTMTTDSNGSTQAMNSSFPVTGKTTVTIRVEVQ